VLMLYGEGSGWGDCRCACVQEGTNPGGGVALRQFQSLWRALATYQRDKHVHNVVSVAVPL
jgi:hypothetical protein